MTVAATPSDEDDAPKVIICQGPPICDLQGDEAEDAMEAGCPWCRREILLPNGEWHTEEPGKA